MSNIVNWSNPNIGLSTISNDDVVICFDFVKFARLENLNIFLLLFTFPNDIGIGVRFIMVCSVVSHQYPICRIRILFVDFLLVRFFFL